MNLVGVGVSSAAIIVTEVNRENHNSTLNTFISIPVKEGVLDPLSDSMEREMCLFL